MNGNGNGHAKFTINPGTGISIGIFLTLVGGIVAGALAFGGIKTDITSAKSELQSDMKDLRTRVTSLESSKNIWSSTDMFKWAVHLQQANPQIKVPEPEVNTK